MQSTLGAADAGPIGAAAAADAVGPIAIIATVRPAAASTVVRGIQAAEVVRMRTPSPQLRVQGQIRWSNGETAKDVPPIAERSSP